MDNTVDNALFLASLHDLDTPHFLAPVITAAASATRKRLVIILFSRLFNNTASEGGSSLPPSPTTASFGSAFTSGASSFLPSSSPGGGSSFASKQGVSHTDKWGEVQRLLTFVYVQATKVAQDMGKVLMEVDVLLRGMDGDVPEGATVGVDIVFRVSGDSIAVPLPLSLSAVRQNFLARGDWHPDVETAPAESSAPPSPSAEISKKRGDQAPSTFPVVALGGTFDHLHAGHKILLSMGAWLASEKLIIGVTDDTLLQNKANKHVLEKLPQRMARVQAFLELFKPGLVYDIVPIDDVCGPTGWDANIQALVVSKETLSGADYIAKHRREHSLPALQTFIIDVISASSSSLDHEDLELLKQTKMSSTFIREWIVMNETGKSRLLLLAIVE